MKTTKISKRFWQVVTISNVDDASSFSIGEPNPFQPMSMGHLKLGGEFLGVFCCLGFDFGGFSL